MKKSLTLLIGATAIAFPIMLFAATQPTLINSGFGQIAGNNDTFGVAICNTSAHDLNQAVPVTVVAGTQTANIFSAASIKAGACEYSYLPYASLGMTGGQTYTIAVSIDPTHSIISNTNNQATYTITAPQAPVAIAPVVNPSKNQTANVDAQSGNFISIIIGWFSHLFGK